MNTKKHIDDLSVDTLDEQNEARVSNTDVFLRTVLCFPKQEQELDDDEPDWKVRWYKQLRTLGHLVALFDVVNFVLDLIFVVGLWGKDYVTEAIFVLVGIGISLWMQILGRRRLHQGGLKPGPFFMKFDAYFEGMPFRRSVLPMVFAVSYTEMCCFLFEDGAFLAAFANIEEIRENPNFFERLNLRLTIAKAAISGSLAIIALLASINLQWFSKQALFFCCWSSKVTKEAATVRNVFGTCWTLITGTCKIIMYVLLWVVAGTVWGQGMQLAVSILRINGDAEEADFAWSLFAGDTVASTLLFWFAGLYFACAICRNGIKKAAESDDLQEAKESPIIEETMTSESEIRISRTQSPPKSRSPPKTRLSPKIRSSRKDFVAAVVVDDDDSVDDVSGDDESEDEFAC